jgi:hypothetical protein
MEVVRYPLPYVLFFARHHKWLMELVMCPLPIEKWVLLSFLAVRELSRRSLQARRGRVSRCSHGTRDAQSSYVGPPWSSCAWSRRPLQSFPHAGHITLVRDLHGAPACRVVAMAVWQPSRTRGMEIMCLVAVVRAVSRALAI